MMSPGYPGASKIILSVPSLELVALVQMLWNDAHFASQPVHLLFWI